MIRHSREIACTVPSGAPLLMSSLCIFNVSFEVKCHHVAVVRDLLVFFLREECACCWRIQHEGKMSSLIHHAGRI